MADHRERGDSYYGGGADLRCKNDDPPNSRLFVICHKSLEEEELRKAFEKFGNIEDIWVVKDRNTGENKGTTPVYLFTYYYYAIVFAHEVTIRLSSCLILTVSLFLSICRCDVHQVRENISGCLRPRGDERQDARLRRQAHQSHDCVQVSYNTYIANMCISILPRLYCRLASRHIFQRGYIRRLKMNPK